MTTVIVPCRMASTRFPGKPLVQVEGKPLFMHAVEAGQEAGFDTIVATPDSEIMEECRKRGVTSVMTSKDCPTGSHRVYEAVRTLKLEGPIINLQGDVVRFPSSYVTAVGNLLSEGHDVVTMASQALALGPNHVRVIVHKGGALSFSRFGGGWKHLGIYGYQPWVLARCFSVYREVNLEQDCFMGDYVPEVIELPFDDSYSVDAPEDVA